MHIEQVTIKNFRCFEHLEVKLNPDVNVFVGNNGSGKSALLDAIAATMYPYVNPDKPSRMMGLYGQRKERPKNFTLRRRDALKQSEIDPLESMEFEAKVYGHQKFEVAFEELPEQEGEFLTYIYSDRLLDFLEATQPEILEEEFSFSMVAYYQGTRSIESIGSIEKIPEQSSNRAGAFRNALNATASFSDLANWFFSKEFQELGEGKRQRNINFELQDLKAVRDAISEIIAPSSSIFFAHNGSSSELKVEWRTITGEEKELWFSQLSSGYRNFMAIVMDFARRLAQVNPHMKNPLETKAILLIDEIDLHLHPTWQQHVVPDLRKVFPNTQLIITTHSPEVVTTVEQHQVFLLENYEVKDCPSPTRGMKSSEVVRYVLGLDDLRPDTEEKQTLIQLFEAIDRGDIAAAKHFREELKSWESFDSDLTRADMQIHRMERRASA